MKLRDREHGERRADEGEIRITDRRRRYFNDNEAETTDREASAPNLKPSYVEELEKRTRAAEQLALDVQARFEQFKSKLQQETDETRQRLNRAADERTERSKAEFIANLLPTLDNLERAIDAAEAGGSMEQLVAGVKQTAESFKTALNSAGVEPLVAQGELFDPELHEAVETIPAEAEFDGRVINEYTRGYRIGDRLLRPARVAVGRAEKAQTAND
ncbi:MAG TPA: nucleotide exchange factor GrpE [Pyrinomonadaceae bacterium]|nr:nucleotide exchange factor GrpE [Pyrinomonadaceae bacterium]